MFYAESRSINFDMTMNKNNMIGLVIIAVVIALYLLQPDSKKSVPAEMNTPVEQAIHADVHTVDEDVAQLTAAYQQQKSGVQLSGQGKVIAILPDDNEGSRHQRFILVINDQHTVLVAHNIDLAPRLDRLQKGDTVEFYGEYEYNPKGGVIHWTHHDPQGRHVEGWLKHKGVVYK